MSQALVFWCTGMSGVGKSTLANYAKEELELLNYKVLILDGDIIREKYNVPLGFGRDDVKFNNLNVMEICKSEQCNYDVIIVPIISPIDEVRATVREFLSPGYYLIYVEANIETLKTRDTKGLYKKADDGKILDLIGYSNSNPYDVPQDYDLKVTTSSNCSIYKSRELFNEYLKKIVGKNTIFNRL